METENSQYTHTKRRIDKTFEITLPRSEKTEESLRIVKIIFHFTFCEHPSISCLREIRLPVEEALPRKVTLRFLLSKDTVLNIFLQQFRTMHS